MNFRLAVGLILGSFLFGCEPQTKTATPKQKPAKIEPHPSEKDIYRIVLTPKAEERLQIRTVPVERRVVPRYRVVGGDVVVPDGQRIPVTAPLTGTLLQSEGTQAVSAGQNVEAGQPLFQLMPMLPPERAVPNAPERIQMANARATLVSARIAADGDVKQAAARVEAAEIAIARAKKLFSDKAGSRRAVDEAQATLNIAAKGLEAANERKRLLDKLTLEAESNSVTAIPIRSPQNGMLQTVAARVGQTVNAGSPLFEIVDLSKMWVKVPVYSGLVSEIDSSRDATVRPLGQPKTSDHTARPISAPPTADPLAASTDLYFEVDNSDGRFRPGERIEIQLPLVGNDAESLVVSRAAILLDIYGTAWVYVNSGEHEFRRERVAVSFSTDDLAVLSKGPDVGTPIVVDGAAELFGTEFGAGK